MEKLYKFSAYFGRMGEISGIFSADEQDIKSLIGKHVYFGEVLGKHSEISCNIEENMFEELTDDQIFIEKFNDLDCSSGYNPFDYIDDEDYDEEEDF